MYFSARSLVAFLGLVMLSGVAKGGDCKITLQEKLAKELSPFLSSGAKDISTVAPPRWSEYEAPRPGAVVNVKTELDVVATVKYCTLNSIPFLAQNGGNGWATTFTLDKYGVMINLAALNKVTFSSDKTVATIGGGANVSTAVSAAYAAGAFVVTGNCNCIGVLGATLGGGYGNLIGRHGFAVDNVLSLRTVLADGSVRDVTAKSDKDLFWALRGAGPNLGVVTSATFKAYPTAQSKMTAWTGNLVYTPDKLEALIQAIQNTDLRADMVVFLYYLAGPDGAPSIIAAPVLLQGTAEQGKKAFSRLYEVGPVADTTAIVPYNHWNDGTNGLCERGGFKPGWSAGFQQMRPSQWREIWDLYVDFQSTPGAASTGILMEAYSLDKAKSFGYDASAFRYRDVRFNAFAIPIYGDPALHPAAIEFGESVRDVLRKDNGLGGQNETYVNFAFGDEPLDEVYGESLQRLRSIKKRYDPRNVFNQWFPIR